MKWEYKTYETLKEPLSDYALKVIGEEGWELAGFTLAGYSSSTSSRFHYIFKRPKTV